jgi:hypothetical protein
MPVVFPWVAESAGRSQSPGRNPSAPTRERDAARFALRYPTSDASDVAANVRVSLEQSFRSA